MEDGKVADDERNIVVEIPKDLLPVARAVRYSIVTFVLETLQSRKFQCKRIEKQEKTK